MNSKIYNNLPTEDDWSIPEGAPTERPTAGSTGSSEYSESSVYSHLSYNPEWKNYIREDGNLFYIKCNPIGDSSVPPVASDNHLFRSEYKRLSMRKNKGILSKIGGAKFKKSLFEVKILSKQKYEHADGILKEFTLTLKYNKLSKLTSAFNLDENLFEQVFDTGLILSPDGARFLINRINESSIFLKEPLVKVGDLLKSIDDELINTQNIHTVLKRVQSQKSVKLVLQEFYPDVGVGVTSEEIKLTNFLEMLDLKSKIFKIQGEPEELVFSLIFINKNESSSDDSDDFETVFCYPPVESNFLFKLKGSFLTLDSISETAFGTTPIITSIKLNETIYHLSYSLRSADNEFLFLGFNSKYLPTMFGVKYMVENLIKFLDFVFPNFRRAENADQIIGICQMIEIQLRKESENGMVNFEKLLGEPHLIPLPKEIQLRINDCLSELEAMDYRNWNEDLIELFGKFNVIGTSLFYKNSMICSHFNILDTLNVELYLKNYCMKLLYNNCAVKEMVIWQRIFPKDYQSFNIQNDAEINKVFLVIVAHGNLLMCVILEENGNNAPIDPDASEDELKESENYLIYFVEEIEDILDHLKIVGIENLTRIWINSQKRPQCKNFENLQGNNQDLTDLNFKSIKEDAAEENDNDNESDWDSQNMDSSHKSSSGFDLTDLSDNIYKDFQDIVPQALTFGPENLLYHYVQLDAGDGIILSSLNDQLNVKNDILLDVFRRSCIKIHSQLQNSLKFRQILSKESKVTNSRSLVAIKEHGVLVKLKLNHGGLLEVWIIGRLFASPQREIYVLVESSIPQNMIEIAFRICLNCVG